MRTTFYLVACLLVWSSFLVSWTSSAQDAPSSVAAGSDKNKEENKTTSDASKNAGSASDVKSQSNIKQPDKLKKSTDEFTYGDVRTSIGVSQPTFGSSLKYYKSLYGSESQEYDISANYYFTEKIVALGIGVGTGFYRDLGFAAKTQTPQSKNTLLPSEIDRTAKVELTLIPLTVSLCMVVTPLPFWHWLQLSLEAGPDMLYVQEVRLTSAQSSTTSGGSEYLNTGWNQGGYVAGSLNINIDALDRMSIKSMGVLGLKSVYFSPYFSIHKTSKHVTASFDRTAYGLMFTFESTN